MTDVQLKTVHGVVDDHVARSASEGPMTIKDHLLSDGIHDIPVLDRVYRKIYTGLKVGGLYHQHLGSTYLLAQHRGGRQPKGFGDNPPIGLDKLLPDASRALITAPLRDIAEDDTLVFPRSVPTIHKGVRAVASLKSQRKQEDISDGMQQLNFERQMAVQKAEFLERENELLRGRSGGPALIERERPRRGAGEQATPTNGDGKPRLQ